MDERLNNKAIPSDSLCFLRKKLKLKILLLLTIN
jgi:hypothetical protein